MKYWKNGFYLEQDNNNSRTEITDEYWATLLYEQSLGKHIVDSNGFPIVEDYVPTQAELNERRITELKMLLAQTDYKAIKYAEGEISEIDYAETKAQRREWRAEINRLGG